MDIETTQNKYFVIIEENDVKTDVLPNEKQYKYDTKSFELTSNFKEKQLVFIDQDHLPEYLYTHYVDKRMKLFVANVDPSVTKTTKTSIKEIYKLDDTRTVQWLKKCHVNVLSNHFAAFICYQQWTDVMMYLIKNGLVKETVIDLAFRDCHHEIMKFIDEFDIFSDYLEKCYEPYYTMTKLMKFCLDSSNNSELSKIKEYPNIYKEINKINSSGQNALNLAVIGNNPEIVGKLLSCGINFDHSDSSGMTTLMTICQKSYNDSEIQTFDHLCYRYAKVNIKNNEGLTCLDLISGKNNLRMEKILKKRMKIETTPIDLKSDYCKVTNNLENHHKFPYETGLNILDKEFEKNGSCVTGGLYFSDFQHIHKYFFYGVNIRTIGLPITNEKLEMVRDPSGDKYRANMIILKDKRDMHDIETYQYLIEKGGKPKKIYEYAYLWALEHQSISLAKKIILLNPNIDLLAALRLASYKGHTEVIKLLVEKGVDANQAIYGAVVYDCFELIDYLLSIGTSSKTIFKTAIEYEKVSIIKHLINVGIDIKKFYSEKLYIPNRFRDTIIELLNY